MTQSSRPGPATEKDLVAWIDRALEEGWPVMQIAGELAECALPHRKGLVSPFVYGSEGWYWPWNRVGFNYIKQQKYQEAASIFSGAYLAALRFQHDHQERIHKGMPLCNVAYSFLLANEVARAQVPAVLGTIEDIFTFGDPPSTASLSNLRASGFPSWQIEWVVNYVNKFYRSRGRLPLYPEVVPRAMRWETFSDTRPAAPFKNIIDWMRQIASQFEPDAIETSAERLTHVWELCHLTGPSRYSRGDTGNERAEPTFRGGPDPIAGTAPIPGSSASR